MTRRTPVLSWVFLAITIAASWFGMMTVHESGHVLQAWLTGGKVAHVVLHPLAFSRTDLAVNPHPLAVAWGGPLWGASLPLGAWGLCFACARRYAFLLRFFAGFCLIANGAYIASALAFPVGDAEDILRLGSPLWAMWAPGVAACIGGIALWSRIGPQFGFGEGRVDGRAMGAATIACATLFAAMLLAG